MAEAPDLLCDQPRDLDHASVRPATPVATLRWRTRDAHEALEMRSPLLSPALTHDTYASVLLAFARVHAAADAVIAAQLGSMVDTGPLMRSHSIRADLDELGCSPPQALTLDVPATSASAWGVLYVSEGSMLGGRVVSGHVRRVLGERAPLRFFGNHGVDVPQRWAATRALLDEHLSSARGIDEAVSAARETFCTFQRELA